MAKWLKDYLSFGSRKVPPQPPTPDYTESEILKAYRLQRDLDFEDPYDNSENRSRGESGPSDPATPVYGSPLKSSGVDMKSPKHRLIKVDSQELGRTKILLSAISLEDHPEPVRVSLPSHVFVGVPNKEQLVTNHFFLMSCMFDEREGEEGTAVKWWWDRYTIPLLSPYFLQNLSNRLHQHVTGCVCHHKCAPLA